VELPASAECLSEELLGAWISGSLPAPELARVEAHVASCAVCLHRVGEAARQDRSAEGRDVHSFGTPMLGGWADVEAWASRHASASEPGERDGVRPALPQRLAERYELQELIAQGGMGEVYRGVELATGRAVAVKRLRPGRGPADAELLARFAREGEILRRLDHPNIVKMLEILAGEGDEQHSIVMEYVAGGSLRRELVRHSVLPPVEALLLTLEVAEALTQAHRCQVIHRDVKPENVLLAEDGAVRLSDFGLARIGERSFTAPGTVLGTVAYLSPEVLWGHDVDERTDLWSLGVMLFEMLSGVRPFAASSPGATLTAILQQPVPELSHFCSAASPELAELSRQLLQKDRQQRPGSAAEVSASIEAILESLVTDTPEG
jgi:serine/threonine protein kinase